MMTFPDGVSAHELAHALLAGPDFSAEIFTANFVLDIESVTVDNDRGVVEIRTPGAS